MAKAPKIPGKKVPVKRAPGKTAPDVEIRSSTSRANSVLGEVDVPRDVGLRSGGLDTFSADTDFMAMFFRAPSRSPGPSPAGAVTVKATASPIVKKAVAAEAARQGKTVRVVGAPPPNPPNNDYSSHYKVTPPGPGISPASSYGPVQLGSQVGISSRKNLFLRHAGEQSALMDPGYRDRLRYERQDFFLRDDTGAEIQRLAEAAERTKAEAFERKAKAEAKAEAKASPDKPAPDPERAALIHRLRTDPNFPRQGQLFTADQVRQNRVAARGRGRLSFADLSGEQLNRGRFDPEALPDGLDSYRLDTAEGPRPIGRNPRIGGGPVELWEMPLPDAGRVQAEARAQMRRKLSSGPARVELPEEARRLSKAAPGADAEAKGQFRFAVQGNTTAPNVKLPLDGAYTALGVSFGPEPSWTRYSTLSPFVGWVAKHPRVASAVGFASVGLGGAGLVWRRNERAHMDERNAENAVRLRAEIDKNERRIQTMVDDAPADGERLVAMMNSGQRQEAQKYFNQIRGQMARALTARMELVGMLHDYGGTNLSATAWAEIPRAAGAMYARQLDALASPSPDARLAMEQFDRNEYPTAGEPRPMTQRDFDELASANWDPYIDQGGAK